MHTDIVVIPSHECILACGYTKTGIGKYTKVFGGTRIVIDRKLNTFIQYLDSTKLVLFKDSFDNNKFNTLVHRIIYLEQRTVGVMW